MAKTREELIFKRRELLKQLDALDRVLEMFPENGAQVLTGNRYAKMSISSAMIDFLTRAESPVVVSEIAKALKSEGANSTSPNFTTMISAVGNRLVESGKLIRKKKNKRKAFAIPNFNGQKE
jgi:hypothetical protein